jgi:hypothetical protein
MEVFARLCSIQHKSDYIDAQPLAEQWSMMRLLHKNSVGTGKRRTL